MTEFKTCNMIDAFPSSSFVDSTALSKLSLKSGKEDDSEDDGDDNDMDIGSNSSCVKWYQKEIWQLTKLPYYEDLERQANKTIASIKAGLSHAILLNDPVTGLMHWVPELERYLVLLLGDDNDMDIGSNSSCVKWYQKEIWQLTKLPYYEDLERQANKTIASIKAGLSHAILLNDPVTGLMHWVPELERYIDYHGRRLSKDDHILFVRLLNCSIKKGNTFRDVKIAMHCLNKLLGKRDFLLRGDLEIDWRPLFDLYVEVSYKNLEDGIFLMPDGFRSELQAYISHARRYFTDNATQQLLDE
ncbi:hypothetical protein COOONC_03197, partial [Cooperia oncophora]